MRMTYRLAALLACGLLAFGLACGGDDDDGDEGSAGGTTTESTDTGGGEASVWLYKHSPSAAVATPNPPTNVSAE